MSNRNIQPWILPSVIGLFFGVCLGVTLKAYMDEDRNIELESLQEDSVYCGFVIHERGELEKMLTGKDERIQGLLKEIEDLKSYAKDGRSHLECLRDIKFVEAEWDTCLGELLGPRLGIPGLIQ